MVSAGASIGRELDHTQFLPLALTLDPSLCMKHSATAQSPPPALALTGGVGETTRTPK